MTKTSLALSNAYDEHVSSSRDWEGYCLSFVRTCLDVPAKYSSAYQAWLHASGRHSSASPVGVPVFFKGNGPYGHIALSAGNGLVWSTDVRRRGKVDLVSEDSIVEKWGQTRLGWSETLNGVRVYTIPEGGHGPHWKTVETNGTYTLEQFLKWNKMTPAEFQWINVNWNVKEILKQGKIINAGYTIRYT